MVKLWVKTLNISFNTSGAAAAARQGNVVMIVDVIDMSTTAEAALEAGALTVLGASPDHHIVPVTVNPEKIGYFAGKKAVKYNSGVIVAAEPRLLGQDDQERINQIQKVVKGIERAGGELLKVIPNIGREVVELVDFKERILIVVSPAGGAAFDAAYNYGASEVITGTVARTNNLKGQMTARVAAERAIERAVKHKRGISVVAASSNSMEDIQAAHFISQEILNRGFLELD